MGFSTDNSYLSKLKNGKTPPASDDLNFALAKITGQDSERLIFVANLEKAPKCLQDYVRSAEKFEKGVMLDIFFAIEEDKSIIAKEEIRNFLEEREIDCEPSDVLEILDKELDISEKLHFLNLLEQNIQLDETLFEWIDKNLQADETNKRSFNENEFQPIIDYILEGQVPLFKNIYGKGLCKKEHFMGYVNPFGGDSIVKHPSNTISLIISDDSLKDYHIQKGSTAVIFLSNELIQEQILLVSYLDKPARFRKVQEFKNHLLLRPLNSEMEIEVINRTDANIIGRLTEVNQSIAFI